jgi:PilZ domain
VKGELVNPRRSPRVANRSRVEVQDRFSSWTASTEDLGPLGCQLVTPRLASPGRELKLRIHCDAIGQTIDATGRVVWTRAESPSRLGIQFQSDRSQPGWFDVLLRADPLAAANSRRMPERLPYSAVLRLGEPPRFMSDFCAEEVAVLRRIGAGITVEALALQLGSAFERVRAHVFALLARRLLVLNAAEAVPPARWNVTLGGAEKSLAASGVKLPAPTVGPNGATGRSAAAQALFDDGIAHLTAGRVEVAVARLREARRLAPTDPLIAGALQRLAPWASREQDLDLTAGASAVAPVGARGAGRFPR